MPSDKTRLTIRPALPHDGLAMRILKHPVTALIVVLVLAASAAFGFSKDVRFGVLLLGLAAVAFVVALAEWRANGRELGVRSPIFWKSALPTAFSPARPEDDLAAQMEALSGTDRQIQQRDERTYTPCHRRDSANREDHDTDPLTFRAGHTVWSQSSSASPPCATAGSQATL
jgi:hypothetical protein